MGTRRFPYPRLRPKADERKWTTEFRYEGFSSEKGVARLPGMPCAFDDDGDDSYTLTVDLRDAPTGCLLTLRYAVFPHQDVIVRSATIANGGSEPVVIESAMSLSLDLPDRGYDLIQLSGAWSRENHPTRSRLRPGVGVRHEACGQSAFRAT